MSAADSSPLSSLSPTERTEFDRLHATLGTVRFGLKYRTTKNVAKALLHDGWWTWNGRFCEPVVKGLGLGVYEVWAREYAPTIEEPSK